jgi:hypothetical protein
MYHASVRGLGRDDGAQTVRLTGRVVSCPPIVFHNESSSVRMPSQALTGLLASPGLKSVSRSTCTFYRVFTLDDVPLHFLIMMRSDQTNSVRTKLGTWHNIRAARANPSCQDSLRHSAIARTAGRGRTSVPVRSRQPFARQTRAPARAAV